MQQPARLCRRSDLAPAGVAQPELGLRVLGPRARWAPGRGGTRSRRAHWAGAGAAGGDPEIEAESGQCGGCWRRATAAWGRGGKFLKTTPKLIFFKNPAWEPVARLWVPPPVHPSAPHHGSCVPLATWECTIRWFPLLLARCPPHAGIGSALPGWGTKAHAGRHAGSLSPSARRGSTPGATVGDWNLSSRWGVFSSLVGGSGWAEAGRERGDPMPWVREHEVVRW